MAGQSSICLIKSKLFLKNNRNNAIETYVCLFLGIVEPLFLLIDDNVHCHHVYLVNDFFASEDTRRMRANQQHSPGIFWTYLNTVCVRCSWEISYIGWWYGSWVLWMWPLGEAWSKLGWQVSALPSGTLNPHGEFGVHKEKKKGDTSKVCLTAAILRGLRIFGS